MEYPVSDTASTRNDDAFHGRNFILASNKVSYKVSYRVSCEETLVFLSGKTVWMSDSVSAKPPCVMRAKNSRGDLGWMFYVWD